MATRVFSIISLGLLMATFLDIPVANDRGAAHPG